MYIYIQYKQNLEFFKTNKHSGHAHIPRNNLELFGAYVLYIKCHVKLFCCLVVHCKESCCQCDLGGGCHEHEHLT